MSELFSHAWLLWGPDPVALREKVWEMIAEAYGQKEDTLRRLKNGSFADLVSIAPESGKVLIDDVRYVARALNLTPIEGDMKFAIIENAHNMNVYAQNAMLKLLEETPARRMIFLTAANTENILPTVLSRVQVKKIDADEEGVVSGAERAALIGFMESIFPAGDIEAVFNAADYIASDKGKTAPLLREIASVFTDIYAAKMAGHSCPEDLKYLSHDISCPLAIYAIKRTNRTISDIASNASPAIALQALFADIREEYNAENRWNKI